MKKLVWKIRKSPTIESCCWTFDSYKHTLLSDVDTLKYKYRSHIAHVKSVVATNRLLVWDVNDGPEPICRFLNKSGKFQASILNVLYKTFFIVFTFDIPSESDLEDQNLMEELVKTENIFQEAKISALYNIGLSLSVVGIVCITLRFVK